MTTIKLGDVAIEAKSSNKGDKTGCKIVGLEHLTPSEVTLADTLWSINQTKQAYLALIKQIDELVKSQFIGLVKARKMHSSQEIRRCA